MRSKRQTGVQGTRGQERPFRKENRERTGEGTGKGVRNTGGRKLAAGLTRFRRGQKKRENTRSSRCRSREVQSDREEGR